MLFGYIFTWTLLLPYLRCCTTVLAAYRNEPTEFKPISISTAKTIARLPNMTRPLYYHLELKVDNIEADKFYGTIIIHVKVLEDTQTIVLHSKYLTILTAGFLKSNKDSKVTWVYDRENEFLILEIQSEKNHKLKKNENEALKISYTGKIRDDNVGLFRKVYYDGSGEKKFLIATQFAPTYARLVFPCYDEPGFKATFSLKITHSRKYDVFSSSPKDSPTIDNIDGSRSTNFQITPEISTYLLSFAVGDFQITESQTAINKIAIIARPDFKHQLTYALEISPHILQGFEKYLDRKLPFTKIDNLAVPSPKYTAMENVGLVVFDENVLMTRPRRSLKHEITIALTIAHEYAHQWFGNLVTPVWWSYFWLNEGMAALLEYNILAKQNVDWDMDQQFIINRLQPALEADAEQNHHPLTFWPKQTKEIEKVFETLSYNKGASIFRMIQHVLTEHSFREALKKYITDCQWKSVTPTDLFHYFNEAAVRNTIFENADIDFEPFLTSWTQQAGYPLVTVTRDYQSGTFRINQEPFDTILKPQKDDKRIWWIPFNFITNNGTFQTTTLDGYLDGSGEQTISPAVKMWNNNDWLILNKQQTGFYRVNYDVKNWIMLIQDINKNPEIIHVNNRAQLIDDAVHLVFVNRLQPSILFNLLKYLIKEDEYAPWKTFEKIYFRLRHHLSEHQDSALFNDFVKDIVSVPYERFEILDSPKEKKSRQLTRNIIINLACQSGYKECLTEVKAQLNNILLSQEAKMNNDLRNTILRNGMISATHLDFSLVLSLLVKSKDTDERQEYMTALGCMQEPSLIRLYLTTAMKRTFDINYSYTERLYVLKSVIQGSSKGLVVAIDFLNGNTIEYSKINAGDKNALYEAIREIGHFIVTKKLNTDFSRLLKKIERHGLLNKEDMKPVEYTIQKNLDWTSRNRKPLVDWLNAYTFEKKSRATTKTGGKVRLSISFLVFMMCHVVSLVVM